MCTGFAYNVHYKVHLNVPCNAHCIFWDVWSMHDKNTKPCTFLALKNVFRMYIKFFIFLYKCRHACTFDVARICLQCTCWSTLKCPLQCTLCWLRCMLNAQWTQMNCTFDYLTNVLWMHIVMYIVYLRLHILNID
jgi:hypothetical protein